MVLSATCAEAAKRDPKEGQRIKESIAKVRIVTPTRPAEAQRSPQQYVSVGKTRYKWLDGGVHFIDAVPKNPSGKILVSALSVRCNSLSQSNSWNAETGA